MRLAILVACYNRVAITLRGLAALKSALDGISDIEYQIFLVDDASPDNTEDAVRACFPDIFVIRGSGGLFWNGGMCRAFEEAKRYSPFDAYMLFNDDLAITNDGLANAFDDFCTLNADKPSILAAATLGPDGLTIT